MKPQHLLIAILCISSIQMTVYSKNADETWMEWLKNPPKQSIDLAQTFLDRAEKMVDKLMPSQTIQEIGQVDEVISGGGNNDLFYLGVMTVFSKLNQKNPKIIDIQRRAGASAGGMMPFEFALKGQVKTLVDHISYGFLQEKFWIFGDQDHHWRLMSKWMIEKYAGKLSQLDDKVYLALSCIKDWDVKLELVHKYTSQKQADQAFMGTGSVFEWYGDWPCSDGGAMSGKNMTPLFVDAKRAQVVVDIMKTGYDHTTSALFSYDIKMAKELIELGQDYALEFVKCGMMNTKCQKPYLSYCAQYTNIKDFICQKNGKNGDFLE